MCLHRPTGLSSLAPPLPHSAGLTASQVEGAFNAADNERERVAQEASHTALRLDLAQRLVKAFASENSRWDSNIQELKQQRRMVVGDVLLAAAFVSYLGPFNNTWRQEICTEGCVLLLAHTHDGDGCYRTLCVVSE